MNNQSTDWSIGFDHYDPSDEGRREALLALGNGFLVSRATAAEAIDDKVHYPGTYRAGVYDEVSARVRQEETRTDSLVNLPNGLALTFRIGNGPWFSLDEAEIVSYYQELNLQRAVLSRTVHFRDDRGQETKLEEQRLVSMAQPHRVGLQLRLTAVNWSGRLEVRSAIDGRVTNNNVPRYAPYDRQHLEVLDTQSCGENGLILLARTRHSRIEIAVAARTRLYRNDQPVSAERKVQTEKNIITDHLWVDVKKGERITLEKCIAYYTSTDPKVTDVRQAAYRAIAESPRWATLRDDHVRAWEQLWQSCSLDVDHPNHRCYFRLHTYHILVNLSPHTVEQDVGVPPSGWQGEEYLGQIFWDELFVMPFLLFRFPKIARALLLYRYRRLPAARKLAQGQGHRGAMYPWRSAHDGEEETPLFQWNPLSDRWMPDHTDLQRHIGVAVAYNVWQYVVTTGDRQFLADYGAEMFLEIARFWASIARYDSEDDRYDICGVAGPDEYHTQYPDREDLGIDNNTYTNVMAVWVLQHAPRILEQLPSARRQALQQTLGLDEAELTHWNEVSHRMRIVFQDDGHLSQFVGYERLKEFDLDAFRKQHGSQRLDRVLEAQHDTVNRYQVTKQADTALLLYLFTPTELNALFERLGYSVDQPVYHNVIDEQLARTAHASTLSRIVYAGALLRVGDHRAHTLFEEAQRVDLKRQDEGTDEGIHLGAMGGTLAMLQHHYLGLRVQAEYLEVDPDLPPFIGQVRMSVIFRGAGLKFSIGKTQLTIHAEPQNDSSVGVSYQEQRHSLEPGASMRFDIF